MKLALATSPHVRHVAVLQSDFSPDPSVMYSFAPLGLLSLAATLRWQRPGTVCSIYDTNRRILSGALPMDEGFYSAVARELLADAPDVVGLMTECDSYHHVLRICAALKAQRSDCYVVLGGPHASAVAMRTMQKHRYVDAIVIGEGEITLPHLLASLGAGAAVPGALVRDADGAILVGGARDLVEDLDSLPIPAYDLYSPDGGEEIFLEVGRGCPFQCSFCSTAPYWRRRHRVKSPARILSEIELLQDLYGTQRVHFTHDLFTTSRAWVTSVCETLIAAGSPIAWTCSARTDTVDAPLLQLMAAAGCSAIYFGIESGSERMLREIRKAIPLERTFEALASCRAAGITPNVGFILGFPTEDRESFEATFAAYERALRSGCSPAHIFAFCPFADSAIYPTLKEIGCSGHFVDLPLGEQVDAENRATVAGDSELHGAFFRPRLPYLLEGQADAIAGADEFSPLVEALLAPALALAGLRGGLARVFELWLPWIRARNDIRGAGHHRSSYGAPLDFADFLIEALSVEASAPDRAVAAAKLLRANLAAVRPIQPTTMANHRSLGSGPSAEALSLESQLVAQTIIATLALEYDAAPVLSGDLRCDFDQVPSFYIWQSRMDGSVRLLRVEEDLFELITELQRASSTVSDLVVRDFAQARAQERAPRGADEILQSLGAAMEQGLVSVGR